MPLGVNNTLADVAVMREPRKKGNAQLKPVEMLTRIQTNLASFSVEEQRNFEEALVQEFLPSMLSRLSQEKIEKISELFKAKLPQSAPQALPPPPAIVASRAIKSVEFFAIPIYEENFTNHKTNIGETPRKTEDQNPVYVGGSGLVKDVFDFKRKLVENTQNAGSNANIVNSPLETSVIVGNGGSAIGGYKSLFNNALTIAKQIAEGIQGIDAQIGKVQEFAKNANQSISVFKDELVRTSKTMAVEQNNLAVELSNPGAITNKAYRGYVGEFAVIEPGSIKVPASEPVTSAEFSSQLQSVNELLNHIHQFQLSSVIAQIGRATGLRHFLSINPKYAQDVEFLAAVQECMNKFKEVHGKQSDHYGKLGGAGELVTQASVQLQSELVQLRAYYETLLKETENVFNVYRKQIVELATNMKCRDEIRELYADAKQGKFANPYEIKQ